MLCRWQMKVIHPLLLCVFAATSLYSQVNITVDAGNVLKSLTGRENGINVDYLMDGTFLSPAITPEQSLKNSKVRFLRYPGGEKSDNYLFSTAPYISASPRMALRDTCFWPTNDYKFVDTNSPEKVCWPSALDFDEFMAMSNNIAATPLVVVAYDAAYNARACKGKPTKAQLITNAVEWVRYANVKKGWNVKYWMVGNESWNNANYNGKVTAAQYAKDVYEFATAMKAVDSTIKIIANGKSGWWQTILESSAVSKIDFLALSEYPVINYTGGYEHYRTNDVNLTEEIDLAISDIQTFAPAQHKNRIKVIAAEYNAIDWNNLWPHVNDLGHALVNFQMFGDIISKNAVEAAFMWNTRWVTNATDPQNVYNAYDANGNENANGKAIRMWGDNLLSQLVSATSDTPSIRAYASADSPGKKLNIVLLNKDNMPATVRLSIVNFLSSFNGSVWQMSGTSVLDKFPVYGQKDTIIDTADISSITLPANSITALRLHEKTVAPALVPFSFQPNPFHNFFKVKLVSDSDKQVSINVYDVMGRKVLHQNKMMRRGSNDIDLNDLAYLRSGVYMISIGDNQRLRTVKVIKR